MVLQMAKELDVVLNRGVADFADSCKIIEKGSVSFLEKVISPIYDTMTAVSSFLPLMNFYRDSYSSFPWPHEIEPSLVLTVKAYMPINYICPY